MRGLLFLSLMLVACDGGPTPEDIAAADAEKDCGKLYSSLTKVLQDKLYEGGVAEVNFGDKGEFAKKCVAVGFTDEQLKCMDPNLGGGDECKKTLEPVDAKVKELQEFLLSPMQKKEEPKKEGEGEGEEKKEGE